MGSRLQGRSRGGFWIPKALRGSLALFWGSLALTHAGAPPRSDGGRWVLAVVTHVGYYRTPTDVAVRKPAHTGVRELGACADQIGSTTSDHDNSILKSIDVHVHARVSSIELITAQTMLVMKINDQCVHVNSHAH